MPEIIQGTFSAIKNLLERAIIKSPSMSPFNLLRPSKLSKRIQSNEHWTKIILWFLTTPQSQLL